MKKDNQVNKRVYNPNITPYPPKSYGSSLDEERINTVIFSAIIIVCISLCSLLLNYVFKKSLAIFILDFMFILYIIEQIFHIKTNFKFKSGRKFKIFYMNIINNDAEVMFMSDIDFELLNRQTIFIEDPHDEITRLSIPKEIAHHEFLYALKLSLYREIIHKKPNNFYLGNDGVLFWAIKSTKISKYPLRIYLNIFDFQIVGEEIHCYLLYACLLRNKWAKLEEISENDDISRKFLKSCLFSAYKLCVENINLAIVGNVDGKRE